MPVSSPGQGLVPVASQPRALEPERPQAPESVPALEAAGPLQLDGAVEIRVPWLRAAPGQVTTVSLDEAVGLLWLNTGFRRLERGEARSSAVAVAEAHHAAEAAALTAGLWIERPDPAPAALAAAAWGEAGPRYRIAELDIRRDGGCVSVEVEVRVARGRAFVASARSRALFEREGSRWRLVSLTRR